MGAIAEAEGPDDDVSRSLASSRLGQTLGERWTLTELLGVGGTASVYAATHRNGARLAIKLLHPELARNARLRRRFLSEGYAANRVGHPGVVLVLDEAECADGTAFLVMELLQGHSLDRLLSARGKLPWQEVVKLTIEILDILAAAHDAHVLHRDLKPSNIFLTNAGQIKLLDFGTAKVATSNADHAITRSGTTLGTPAFMAPELAAGRTDDVDALTDIWAVGATMFQLLVNRTVHVASSTQGAIVAAATRAAPRLRSLSPEQPEALGDIVDRALAYQKCDRFPNARAMQAELRLLLGINAPPSPPGLTTAPEVTNTHATRLSPYGSWPWVLLAGSGLALAAFLAWPRSQPTSLQGPIGGDARGTTASPAQKVLDSGASAPVPPSSGSVAEPTVSASDEAALRQPLAAQARPPKPPNPPHRSESEESVKPASDASDLLDLWR